MPGNLRYAFAAVSLVLYVASLCLPALDTKQVGGNVSNVLPGIQVLLEGWMGFVDGNFTWVANPLAAVAWVALLPKFRWPAGIISAVAIAVALTTSYWVAAHVTMQIAEGGPPDTIEHLYSGFYCWLGSMVAILAGSCYPMKRETPAISPP